MDNCQVTSLLNPKVVAAALGVQVKTLAQWRSSRALNLPYCKVGGRVMYKQGDVEKFIAGNMQGISVEPNSSGVL